jgi:NADH:ubiquinone oxidoreductase subunit C
MNLISKNSFSIYLYKLLPKFFDGIIHNKTQKQFLVFTPPVYLNCVLSILKNHLNFNYLFDLFVVDFVAKTHRFSVYYTLRRLCLSTKLLAEIQSNKNLTISVLSLADDVSDIMSVVNIFKSAGWLEREMFDLFGVMFHNNGDLRRILTDYGFFGFPFRRDFPLSGYIEVRYDDSQTRIVYEPIELSQEFRFFDMLSPWISRT